MPAATAPMRVPPRRARGSLSSASGSTGGPQSPNDEISNLSLAEVRDRLARNERVLNSALMSTSPTARTGPSFFNAPPNGNASPHNSPPLTSPNAGDPVRARLLVVRQQLCAREAELLADSVGSMDLAPREMAASPPTRSAKANALAAIRQGEAAHPTNPHYLPIDSTLALGERDFDNQWTQQFANVGIASPSSSRAPSGRGARRDMEEEEDDDDELARSARASRLTRERLGVNDDEDNSMFASDEAYAAASVYASKLPDLGNGLPMSTARARRDEGFDDDMASEGSREGDRDDEFPEGNDEYVGGGAGTMRR